MTVAKLGYCFSAALLLPSCALTSRAQSAGAPPAVIAEKDALTRAQLDTLLSEEHTGDEQAKLMHVQLEQKRATLPKWFPAAVWDDVEAKVEAVRYADAAYPVYRKYMTSEQADLMILFFKGSTGQALASVLSGRADAQKPASKDASQSGDVQKLFLQRTQELGPSEQRRLVSALPEARSVLPQVEQESNAAYNTKAREVLRATVAAHQAEINQAQQSAGAR